MKRFYRDVIRLLAFSGIGWPIACCGGSTTGPETGGDPSDAGCGGIVLETDGATTVRPAPCTIAPDSGAPLPITD
jgi:hypothetical protein